MNQAQMSLQAAQAAQAQDYDPVDLGFARERFQQALDAVRDHKYDQAARLAEETRADSDLARVKSQLAAARSQIQSKTADNQNLRDQLERAQAAAAAPPAPVTDSSAAPAVDSGNAGDMPAPPASMLAPPNSGGPAADSNQGGGQ